MEPELLSLRGQVDQETAEAAIDAIRARRYPGWRISYDRIRVEMVAGQARSGAWDSVAGAARAFTQSMAQSPSPVWVIVATNAASGRSEIVKLLLVGGDEHNPIWERIRPDASVPLPQGRVRIRPRRKRRKGA